ncbi:MAG: hypothetical protein KGI27_14625 [Thaumarchaeota archaeon]|nr:hypothetical protein [Nitrososphaerota archaeon]
MHCDKWLEKTSREGIPMAKFSKQHYQEFAGIFREEFDSIVRANEPVAYKHAAADKMWGVIQRVSDLFERDNERFNRDHFMAVIKGERPVNSRPPRG